MKNIDENIIEVRNVSYSYMEDDNREKFALTDVSLNINRGEYLAVLGHNGSGKSSLAKLLNAINLPTKGQILIKGMDSKLEENVWEIRKNCGMVFQNPDNQIIATSVEEEVAFGPENLGVSPKEIRERVDRALEIVEMSSFAKREPSKLSGGQKQRVAIAGILAINPDIIVLDEPTSMLDPRGRSEIMKILKKLNDEGKTIINITHFMEEAVQADRIVIMDDGHLAMDGSPEDVFEKIDFIKELGLDIPLASKIYHRLKSDGFDLKGPVLSLDQLVEVL